MALLELDLADNGGKFAFDNPEAIQRWVNTERHEWEWLIKYGGPICSQRATV